MTKTKQQGYSAELKESAVRLAIESQQSMARTAKELGITKTTLYAWVNKYSKPKEPTMRTGEHLYDELKRLKKELIRVTQERDLLEEAAAYFAKESR